MEPIPTPLYLYGVPLGSCLKPLESSKPITSSGYELRSKLIHLVQKNVFFGSDNENPYSHLGNFEQTYAYLSIEGMSNKTLRWKVFPFSLTRKPKRWYNRHVRSSQGD
jgi:hypothetical protein